MNLRTYTSSVPNEAYVSGEPGAITETSPLDNKHEAGDSFCRGYRPVGYDPGLRPTWRPRVNLKVMVTKHMDHVIDRRTTPWTTSMKQETPVQGYHPVGYDPEL